MPPEIPPNSDMHTSTENIDQALSGVHYLPSGPQSQQNQSAIADQDFMIASSDLSGQSLGGFTQTNGALTTMAQSSAQEDRSEVTLSGAAGLRPQNLFHRDEMFQIYLQRPPPPSPLRNLLRQRERGQQVAQHGHDPPSQANNARSQDESLGTNSGGLINIDEMSQQMGRLQVANDVQVDESLDVLEGFGSFQQSRGELISNIQSQGLRSRADIPTLNAIYPSNESSAAQSAPQAKQEPAQIADSQVASQSLTTQVYHSLIENQHRSNQ